MYSNKNLRFTFHHLTKLIQFHTFLLCLILLQSGCSSKDIPPVVNEQPTTLITSPTPIPEIAIDPTPTLKPSASVIPDGEEITTKMAEDIIYSKIDSQIYSLTLISEDLDIDSKHYIAFLANKDSLPLEPVLIVNRQDGAIACLSSKGKCISFYNFPYSTSSPKDESTEYDWSGTYYKRNEFDRIIGTVMIGQNDSSSFEFLIHTSSATGSFTLAGIGHFQDNYAIFTDESDQELVFSFLDNTVSIYDSDQVFASDPFDINGTYTVSEDETEHDFKIGVDRALELVSMLTTYQTKLPAEISEYSLLQEENLIIVKDRICYVINAYATFQDNKVRMTTFYVSVDGSVIFVYDDLADDPYSIVPLR